MMVTHSDNLNRKHLSTYYVKPLWKGLEHLGLQIAKISELSLTAKN